MYIDIIPVTITMQKRLNSTQGRIFSRKIINISEEGHLKSVEDRKEIEIRKMTKKKAKLYLSRSSHNNILPYTSTRSFEFGLGTSTS